MSNNCADKPNLNSLREEFGLNINYSDLLNTTEWCIKRKEIIKRDNRKCRSCNAEETIHVTKGKHAKVKIISEVNPAGELIHDAILVNADKPIILHVHHTLYVLDKLPWEYENETLITLCHDCHNKLHQENIIPVYSTIGDLLCEISPCNRCNGSGYLTQFSYFKGGICFGCNGERFNKKLFTLS